MEYDDDGYILGMGSIERKEKMVEGDDNDDKEDWIKARTE